MAAEQWFTPEKPQMREAGAEGVKFKASLGNSVWLCLKAKVSEGQGSSSLEEHLPMEALGLILSTWGAFWSFS